MNESVDMRYHSRSLAYHLSGAAAGDVDLYVMINTYSKDLEFEIQAGSPEEWELVIDTAETSPNDFREESQRHVLSSMKPRVTSRSIVVLVRR